MKYFSALILGISLLGFSAQAGPTSGKMKFKVAGMMCGACAMKVETALKGMKGIKVIDVNSDKGEAVIEVAKGTKFATEKFAKILKEKAGFAASSFSAIQ